MKSTCGVGYAEWSLARIRLVYHWPPDILTHHNWSGVLLRELAYSFLHDLRLTSGDATAAIERVTSPGQMTWFVEDHVIQPVGGPLVLVIDEVDKVFEQDYRSDFFGMIRAWHNARTRVRSKWKQVDLVLAISTEPHLLMVDRYQSPFNVSPPIRLTWFELSHVEQLNARYGQPLPHDDVVRLHEFLGGHPFLTHLALHRLSRSPGTSLVRFLLDATAHDGDFGPHLDTMLAHLHERPELRLVEGFQQIARYGQAPNDDVAYRLQAAGLVRRDNHQVVPSNELYARYFGSIR